MRLFPITTRPFASAVLLLGSLLPQAPAAALHVEHSIDPETGLEGWKLVDAPLELELIQRLPDQTRGFFIARGFTPDQADAIARACVFQTIVRNTSPAGSDTSVEVDLRRWHLAGKGGSSRPIRVKEDWLRSWQGGEVTTAARVAFEWSTFPTHQVYRPGDYNWGMTTLGVEPGTTLDLAVEWRVNGEIRSYRIESLRCAPEELTKPAGDIP